MRHTMPASYEVLVEQAQALPSRARLRSVTAVMMLQQQWPVAWLDTYTLPIYVFAQPPRGSSRKQSFSGSKGLTPSCPGPLTSSGVSAGHMTRLPHPLLIRPQGPAPSCCTLPLIYAPSILK